MTHGWTIGDIIGPLNVGRDAMVAAERVADVLLASWH